MDTTAVGSSTSSALQTQAAQRKPESAEVKGARDNDGDSDDGAGKVAQSPPTPTVNLNGQKLGQIINASA